MNTTMTLQAAVEYVKMHVHSEGCCCFVSKVELFMFVPVLIEAGVFAFEVCDMEDGSYMVSYRTKNDNDVCMLKEYERSKLTEEQRKWKCDLCYRGWNDCDGHIGEGFQ